MPIGARRGTLIERENELAAIADALGRARAGAGSLLVIDGPPGIGKTRVLAAAHELAEADGQSVLRARGAEFEDDFAFGVVRQLFEPAASAMDAPRRQALGDQAAGLALDVLDRSGSAVRAEPTVGLLHGVFWLAAELAATTPLVLTVDDAHWADAVSLRAVAYIARRVESLPVLVIATTRSGAAEHRSPLSALLATPGATFIRLRALTARGTRTLTSDLSDQPIDVEAGARCHAATGGNPFLVTELVRVLQLDGQPLTAETVERVRQAAPSSLTDALMLRLDSLPAEAVAVAQAVAVLGDGAATRHTAALAGLPVSNTVAAAESLADAGVLGDGELLSFAHPLLRSAFYGSLSSRMRGDAHQQAADLLRGEGAEPDRIAAQLLASTPLGRPDSVKTLVAAATNASRRGAFDAAARLLGRALSEPPPPGERGDVLLALGQAELAAGERASAVDHLRAALDAALDDEGRVAAALALAQRGGIEDPVELLDRVAAGVDDSELALRVDVVRTSIARYIPGRSADALERMRSYSTLRGETADQRLALATVAAARASQPEASARDTARIAELALGDDLLIREQTGDAQACSLVCHALLSCEAFEMVQRQVELLLADAQERGSPFAFFAASCAAGSRALLTGDLVGAIAHCDAGLNAADEIPGSLITAAGASFLTLNATLASVERGDVDHAVRLLASLRGADATWVSRMHADLANGHVSLATGRPGAALDLFLHAARSATNAGSENRQTRWRLGAARAAAALGRTDEAAAYADEQLELDRTWGAPGGLGESIRVRAVIGDPGEACERLEEAVAALSGAARKLELAHALVALGIARRRAGQRTQSRGPLSDGHELAASCGAWPLAERARSELVIAGARPQRDPITGRDALTPSERRIAELAARGLTNRAIAQELFVTPKTVELHLTSTYRKLGISGRTSLATALDAAAP